MNDLARPRHAFPGMSPERQLALRASVAGYAQWLGGHISSGMERHEARMAARTVFAAGQLLPAAHSCDQE